MCLSSRQGRKCMIETVDVCTLTHDHASIGQSNISSSLDHRGRAVHSSRWRHLGARVWDGACSTCGWLMCEVPWTSQPQRYEVKERRKLTSVPLSSIFPWVFPFSFAVSPSLIIPFNLLLNVHVLSHKEVFVSADGRLCTAGPWQLGNKAWTRGRGYRVQTDSVTVLIYAGWLTALQALCCLQEERGLPH